MLSGKRDRFKGIWEARKCSFKGQVRANTKYSATKLHPQPSRGVLFKRQMWNKPWTWDRINDEIPWSQKATWKVLEANPGGRQPWWSPTLVEPPDHLYGSLRHTLCRGSRVTQNAAAESLAHQQPDGSTKPGAWWCKPQKTPEALSCVALEARHLLCVGHLPRFDITAVLKGSMKFCWLRRTKTVFASRNSYYLSFTLDFLALAIISNSRTMFCSERVVY